uniref:DUF5915 domain-containing protein n=1 Tax=Methanococcoides sp. TaxID=1966350 RepID=UPI00272DD6E5
TTAKLIAPFMPHLAEEMYQNLVRNVDENAPVTIHLCDWPVVNEALVDASLEAQMKVARSIVEASSNARQKVGRKLRWPVSRIVVSPTDENTIAAVEGLRYVLMDQTNAKDIETTNVGESWNELGVKSAPNPGAIGPVFKGDAGKISAAIGAMDAYDLKKGLAGGKMEITLADGTNVTITEKMVNFSETVPEDVGSAEFNGGVVFVDAKLSREIESEGYSREVIRRIQDMRKELDLDVDDSIRAHIQISDERVLDLVLDFENYIAKEVRANVLVIGLDVETTGELAKEWNVEGIPMTIAISKEE